MVWGAIYSICCLELQYLYTQINSTQYINALSYSLLSFLRENNSKNYVIRFDSFMKFNFIYGEGKLVVDFCVKFIYCVTFWTHNTKFVFQCLHIAFIAVVLRINTFLSFPSFHKIYYMLLRRTQPNFLPYILQNCPMDWF